MPAPSRRNKGESLAHKIGANAAARKVADDRDNLVAARTRKDSRWEAAAAALHGSVIFNRPVAESRAKAPVSALTPQIAPRLWMGYCLRCEREMWVQSPKKRLPICECCL